MKIALGTVELTEEDREAIAERMGTVGPASREACREFVRQHGISGVDDLVRERHEANE